MDEELNAVSEGAREIDVGALLENRRLGRFHALTFCLCLATLFVAGLNYSAVNVAAPAIARALAVDPSAMRFVFGWGFVGLFIGSVTCGYIGDKFGRKTGIVISVLTYGAFALVTLLADSLNALAISRALVGFGLGGVVPNVAALLNETAPKRYKVTAVMAVFIGYSSGNATIAQVAAWLIPSFGWQIVFLVAGIAGTMLSVALLFLLPESIPFLAATRPDAARLRRLVARAAPEIALTPDTRLVYRRPKIETEFSLKLLFAGYRRVATPLIWIAFFAESLTYMTLTAWLTTLLEGVGLEAKDAALAYSYAQLGAIFAILLIARLLDRYGPRAAAFSAVVAVTALAMIGTSAPPSLVILIAVLGVAFASATHQSLLGMAGAFYPTIIRGNGVGYASGMGRIAAILGPVIAGYLIAKFSAATVLIFIAAPDLVVAAACIGLDRFVKTDAPRGTAPVWRQDRAASEKVQAE